MVEQADNAAGSTEDNAAGVTQTPGAILRAARSAKHLSLDEMMAHTKLTEITMHALESDDFEVLCEPVFVRGYYRKCAKILELNEDDLLNAYDALHGGVVRTPKLVSLRRVDDSSVNWLVYLIYGLLGGLLVLLSVWWFTRTPEMPQREEAPVAAEAEPSEAQTEQPAPVAAKPEVPAWARVPNDAEIDAEEKNPNLQMDDRLSISQAPPAAASNSAAAASIETAAESVRNSQAAIVDEAVRNAIASVRPSPVMPPKEKEPEEATNSERELTLTFNEDSWVRIDDADDNRLLGGLVSKGEERVMNGPAPFTIFLGNAPGVKVQLDGKEIDLAPYIQSNRVARFEAGGS